MDADYAEYTEKRGQNYVFLRGHPRIQRSPRPAMNDPIKMSAYYDSIGKKPKQSASGIE